ncbi:MAG: hypothetical protein U0457_07660 [Candidatus Sericytochromatia bacterium]
MRVTKFLLSSLVVASSFIFSCGQYTNFPAQYHVDGVNSILNGSVTYGKDTVTVKQPKIVMKGEAGSIGVTFEKASIKYSVGDVTAASLGVSYRIDSSHNLDKDNKVVVGQGSFELPIINQKVIEVGKRASQNIFAEVTLTGSDDAALPAEIRLSIPIYFIQG